MGLSSCVGRKPEALGEKLDFHAMYRLVWEDPAVLEGIPYHRPVIKDVDFARELKPRPLKNRVALSTLSLTTHIEEPPENELQKVGERVMSEHELRVQRSLQRLNVPDWFKNNQVPSQGFLLKRHSEGGATTTTGGWQGLSSKTTSLSSLGSRSPTGNLLSPSPTPSTHTFSRWSTNRLASNPGSTSTSPSGSARSSFNYRQPYLGWRSQERLAHPRTPAERLAAGILPQKQATPPPNVPNLSEVHSSIKEVTSAIVHYVSGANKEDRLSPNPPRHDSGSSRSASPRGSTSRFCWLESSFVGNRPVDVPETPVSLTATPEHGKDLYLDLNSISSPGRQINDSL